MIPMLSEYVLRLQHLVSWRLSSPAFFTHYESARCGLKNSDWNRRRRSACETSSGSDMPTSWSTGDKQHKPKRRRRCLAWLAASRVGASRVAGRASHLPSARARLPLPHHTLPRNRRLACACRSRLGESGSALSPQREPPQDQLARARGRRRREGVKDEAEGTLCHGSK